MRDASVRKARTRKQMYGRDGCRERMEKTSSGACSKRDTEQYVICARMTPLLLRPLGYDSHDRF